MVIMCYTYTSAEVREHFEENKAETALELSKWGDGSTAAVLRREAMHGKVIAEFFTRHRTRTLVDAL